MTVPDWHVDDDLWDAYAGGHVDEVAAASIDAHVERCTRCQASARTTIPAARTESVWQGIRAEIQRPRMPRTVRWLRRLGVSEPDQVILAACDGFVLPWSLAVGSALICALLAAGAGSRQYVVFWLIAPVAPVVAVLAAFDAVERLHAIMGATPYNKVRLALLRTVATLAVAVPAMMAVGLLIPGLAGLAFAWLLPSLLLTATALLLQTWVRSWPAVGSVAVAWVVSCSEVFRAGDVAALSAVPVQLGCLALTAAMTALFVSRSTSFGHLGGERSW